MEPLVSVVMPAYNGEKYIGDAIKSIIEQTYQNWELIIVDDASTDNTAFIAAGYQDSRIKMYRNSANNGIAYSTNKAIQMSKGKYIALLDDDDMATADRLFFQVEFLEKHPDIDILGGRSVCIDEMGDFLMHDILAPLHNPRMIKAWMHFENRRFSNGTTMIRAEFIKKNNLEFKNDYYGIQDFKFIADSSKVGNISSIDRVLQLKRIHPQEATMIYSKYNSSERKAKYAQLQRESLHDSGFRLNEEQIKIINECLPERPVGALTTEETVRLIGVFDEIIRQAEELEIEYIDELQKVCRNIIIERMIQRLNYKELSLLFARLVDGGKTFG